MEDVSGQQSIDATHGGRQHEQCKTDDPSGQSGIAHQKRMATLKIQTWKSRSQRCRLGARTTCKNTMGGGCHGIKKRVRQVQGCLRGVHALLYAGFRSRQVNIRKQQKPSFSLREQGHEIQITRLSVRVMVWRFVQRELLAWCACQQLEGEVSHKNKYVQKTIQRRSDKYTATLSKLIKS